MTDHTLTHNSNLKNLPQASMLVPVIQLEVQVGTWPGRQM